MKRRQVMQLNRRKTKRQRKECGQKDGGVKLTREEVNLMKNGHMLKAKRQRKECGQKDGGACKADEGGS